MTAVSSEQFAHRFHDLPASRGTTCAFIPAPAERLADIAACSAGERLYHMRLTALCRNHDHWNAFHVLDSRKLFDKLQAVHHRHVDIAKDQIDLAVPEHSKRLSAIPGLEYVAEVNARLAQRAFHDLSHDRGVVNNESTYGHKYSFLSRKKRGWVPALLRPAFS